MDLEIDATDCRTIDGQTFFLFSKREAGKVIARCFARFGWSPAMVPFHLSLPPAGKGNQWIATDYVPPVSPVRALYVLHGLAALADAEEARAIVAWGEANPESLTSGQACRGLESLRAMLERGDLC
jgi:hypothetical protein